MLAEQSRRKKRKKMNRSYLNRRAGLRKATGVLTIVAIAATSLATVTSGQSMGTTTGKSGAKLSEDQRILHVLNRLGFGARPGDVERVRAMGIDKYIEQQLNPDKIDDSASEAKLQNLTTLRMDTAELYEKYPQPGQLLNQLQRRGALPAELAAARDNRVKGGANTPDANNGKTGDAMTAEANSAANSSAANPKPANNNPDDQNPMNN